MLEIISNILPIFIIIAIGTFTKYVGLADDRWTEILNKFALYVAFPAVIFTSITALGDKAALNYHLFFYNSILLILAFIAVYIVLRFLKVSKSIRNCYLTCAVFGNAAYLGFPYITAVLPESGGAVSITVASYIILMFTMVLWVLERTANKKTSIFKAFKNSIKNPMLISAILGVAFVQFGIALPEVINSSLGLLAKGASPIVLFALGIFLAKKIEFNRKMMHSAIISGLKLLVLPPIFILFGAYVAKDASFGIAIIEAGMPTALTWFALSEIYPMDRTIVVYSIIISTVVSVITLPIVTLLVI